MTFRRFLVVSFVAIALFTWCLGLAIFLQLNEGTAFVNAETELKNPLHVPPRLEPRMENGEKVFDLTAQEGEVEFLDGKQTKTLGFNGDYLGPTIRARTGDNVRVSVTNNLGEMTTVHWHGMHLPPAMDGGPHQTIEPGATWQPNWTITNEAATLWYHPHQMEVTGEQVYRGLAGLFIIDDDNSNSLDLPDVYGMDDIPLVVQDRQFDDNGQFVYQRQGRFGSLCSSSITPMRACLTCSTVTSSSMRTRG